MRMSRVLRRTAAGLAVAVASATVFVALPGAAHAAVTPELACAASAETRYEPGMTTEQRRVRISQWGQVGPCLLGAHGVRSGTWELHAEGNLSCLAGSGEGTRTYYWKNGERSIEEVRETIAPRPEGQSVLITEGKIVKGVFAGAITRSQAVLAHTDLLACHSSNGVTSTSGPRTLLFDSVL